MTRAILLLAVMVAGCDSAGDGLLPIRGGLIVALPPVVEDAPIEEQTPPSTVALWTGGTYDCNGYAIVVETRHDEAELRINARGVAAPQDGCRPVIVSASASVGLPAGAGDGYRVVVSGPDVPRAAYVLVERDGRFEIEPTALR